MITNIVLFSESLVLASFVSSSYEKTYESLLFTVFLADYRLKKMKESGYVLEALVNTINIERGDPNEVYRAVELWFMQEAR